MAVRREPLGIIGAGSFGTALAAVVGGLGHPVMMWTRRAEQAEEIDREHTNEGYARGYRLPETVRATSNLQEAARGAAVVLVAVPSKALRQTARELGDVLTGDQLLVHATKGFEIDTFRRMSEILREETCARKIGVLSGPTLAPELLAGHPAGALVASRFDEVVEAVQGYFRGSHLRVYGGRDVVGTEVGGAFKNIVALAAGVSDGLGMGDNTRSLLVTRGLSEMAQLGVSLGGDVFTFGGLAGIGDLMATCGSRLSRNHLAGERMAKGEKLEDVLATMGHVVEGVPTAAAVQRHAARAGLDLPIVRAVHSVLFEGMSALDGVGQLMKLPVGTELAALRFQRRRA